MTCALPEVTVIILRLRQVPYIDQSVIYVIEDPVIALKEWGMIVLMAGIQE